MSVSLVEETESTNTSNDTAPSHTMTGNPTNDNLLLAILIANANDLTELGTGLTANGWTAGFGATMVSVSDFTIQVYHKIAASEGTAPTYSTTLTNSARWMLAIQEYSSTTGWTLATMRDTAMEASAAFTANTTNWDLAASGVLAGTDEVVLVPIARRGGGLTSWTFDTPTGFVQDAFHSDGGGGSLTEVLFSDIRTSDATFTVTTTPSANSRGILLQTGYTEDAASGAGTLIWESATETDAATDFSLAAAGSVALVWESATETDTATDHVVAPAGSVALVWESATETDAATDLALAVAGSASLVWEGATETDAATDWSAVAGGSVSLIWESASETATGADWSLSTAAASQTLPWESASESDAATDWSASAAGSVGLIWESASETDVATDWIAAPAGSVSLPWESATETDAAVDWLLGVAGSATATWESATETDTAANWILDGGQPLAAVLYELVFSPEPGVQVVSAQSSRVFGSIEPSSTVTTEED